MQRRLPRGVVATELAVADPVEQVPEPWPPPLLKNVGALLFLWLGSFLLLIWLAGIAKNWAAAAGLEAV